MSDERGASTFVTNASPVRVDLGGVELARSLLDQICELYDEVFSEPPSHWQDEESELHRGRLLRLLDDPTFGITVARDGEKLMGFAYGFTVPVDTKAVDAACGVGVGAAIGGVARSDLHVV